MRLGENTTSNTSDTKIVASDWVYKRMEKRTLSAGGSKVNIGGAALVYILPTPLPPAR